MLGDGKKRALYDQIRAGGGMPRGNPFGGGGGGDFTYTTQGSGGPGVFDLGDLFTQFFSEGRGGPAGAGGGRVRVEYPEDAAGRRRGGRASRGREAQQVEAEPERRVKASDGSWLRVEGLDVHSDVRIPFDHAILGTVAKVATLDSKAEVKIPPGTSSGKRLRLRGKGVPDPAGRVGDHYITVQIDVPSDLDDEARKQLVQLATRLRKRGHPD